jgi:hypothetical protein
MHYYLQSLMHHPFLVTTIYNALLPQGQVEFHHLLASQYHLILFNGL